MNKIFYLLIFLIFLNGCSSNNSKLWPLSKKENTENLKEEKKEIVEQIFTKKKIVTTEFNPNLVLKLTDNKQYTILDQYLYNNYVKMDFNKEIKNPKKFKFKRIKNFYQYESEISFNKQNLIFFENKGTIFKIDENYKVLWRKNYYTKNEKKLEPILQFSNQGQFLIVTDNIARYYMLDVDTGELIWSKNSLAPFNSQIKILKDKFFVIDFSNTLRCFSLKNGNELWNVKTQNSLIRSQKRLSIVIIDDIIYFNNSIGDISAVDLNKGELIWQLPTQNTLIYESSFSLETSDIVSNGKQLFFSNNNNQFFSVDLSTGSFNWETKINSNLRPSLIGNALVTVSSEGYLFIIDKNNGNIIRVTDVFNVFKSKQRDFINPTGFIIGGNNLFLSTNNGKLLVIDITSGKTVSVIKIDNKKILKPIISNNNLFVARDNAIIKLH